MDRAAVERRECRGVTSFGIAGGKLRASIIDRWHTPNAQGIDELMPALARPFSYDNTCSALEQQAMQYDDHPMLLVSSHDTTVP